MKRNIIKSATVLACCATLVGCGINATSESMTYDYQQASNSIKKPKNRNLLNATSVNSVKGGHEINPMIASEISNRNYKLALEQSLLSAKLLEKSSPAYSLDATIIRLARPMIGLDFTSTLSVDYKLSRVDDHKTVYHKTITATYTAQMKDSLIGATRLKMANEGAARENIKLLMNDLYKIN